MATIKLYHRYALYLLLLSFLFIGFIACGDDTATPADIEKGRLAGSTWVREYEYYSEVLNMGTDQKYDITYSFTSDREGKYTKKGYTRLKKNNKWEPKQDIDEAEDFTYVYAPTERSGVIYMKNGKDQLFIIKTNYTQLTFGTSNHIYELQ